VNTQQYFVKAGGFGYGPIAMCDPGEVVALEHGGNDSKLIEQRKLVPLTPDAKPVSCSCKRRFTDTSTLQIHRTRSHKEGATQ
jgi:hypothetical protein